MTEEAPSDEHDDAVSAKAVESNDAVGDPAHRPVRRWIGIGVLTLGILILLSAGWVGWRTYQAYHHLRVAADEVSTLQAQVKNLDAIDLSRAGAAVAALQTQAHGARTATADPLYRLAGHLPWIGPDLRAISSVALIVDGLASTTAPSLIDVATSIRPAALAPHNGTIDIAPIAAAAPRLQTADSQVRNAIQSVAAIDRSELVNSVAHAVNTLQSKLVTLSATTGSAARIGRLVPPMLGAQGPRNYLVVFQNLAEPRATGGIFGSYALLGVANGRLQIIDQGSGSRDLGTFDPPLTLPSDLPAALYGKLPGQYATDVNLTPDFPTSAALIAAMYTQRRHVEVDGVLSVDPVALSYLLVGLQPIDLGNGLTLTSSNVSSLLMSKAYARYPNPKNATAREAFLSVATEKAFAAATTSGGDAQSEVKGLRKAMSEHRLLLWSASSNEQADLDASELGGSLGSGSADAQTIGVYRNDGTGGKLGYYASGSISLSTQSCDLTGHRNLTLTIQMNYSAPTHGLPPYVLGYAKAGPYVLRTNILVFAPLDGDLTALLVDGRPVPMTFAVEGGRKVGMITVDQQPGEAIVITGSLTMAAARTTAEQFTPVVMTTPGITNWKSTAPAFPAC